MEEECGPCGGPPPPQFSLPPPPRPPFLVDGDCSEDGPLLAFEVCDALPVLDAELHSSPAIPSTAVIVGSCVLLLATLLIVSVLLFKYKRKVPNAAPNKAASAPVHCDTASSAGLGGVGGADPSYEDSGSVRPRTAPPAESPKLQMTDLKSNGAGYPNGFPVLRDPSLYVGSHPYISEDLYNPVYEEISHGSGERGETDSELPASEDEFAEDELSLAEAPRPQRSPPPPLLHSLAASAGSLDGRSGRTRPPPPGLGAAVSSAASESPFYEPTSPDLRYSRCTVAHLPSPPPPAPASGGPGGSVRRSRGHRSNDSEFHEGMLLDALLHQLYYQQQQQQQQHSLPFASPHVPELYGPHRASPQLPHRTLPHFYHHPGAEVFTTLRHHHAGPAASPVQHRHHHQQQAQRRRPPVAHSGSALGLS
ncbi:atrophin-1-like [Schistocerca serialis cubense]|uniref:atrophin-1-like n=1 Tax=Schistocerca serialis cubense TaxID=2023355 RepID=UPI00214EAD1D|nr:atrophin-1-like [Schistocerca serialis cubense]